MLPLTVAEQQAKLAVSAEESKALRLKRQQARFRDRGGAFVPSTSNPLVDILLARTVSGESPSRACSKHVPAKRRSPAKAHQSSPTRKAGVSNEIQTATGSSKPRQPQGKRKAKAVEPEADPPVKPPPKRRGTTRAKKKIPDPGSDTEQPCPSTSSEKGKGRGNVKTKPMPKPKAQTKTKAELSLPKAVVEVLVSDDDSTLVEVPHKVKSNPKREIRIEIESDDDAPIVKKRAKPRAGNSKASGAKAATRVKAKKTSGPASSMEKIFENDGEGMQGDEWPKATAKKRPVVPDGEDAAEPVTKKGKVTSSTSAKPKAPIEPKPVLRPTKDVAKRENSKATGKGKGRIGAEPIQDVVGPVVRDDERPLDRVSKPKKRKTEEDIYDDWPRKVVKFSETGPTHSSSHKLKENQSERKRGAAKSNVKNELNVPCAKLTTKPPSRAKTPKGPPQEVLERIKASAARHLRYVDSDPDELDCLS